MSAAFGHVASYRAGDDGRRQLRQPKQFPFSGPSPLQCRRERPPDDMLDGLERPALPETPDAAGERPEYYSRHMLT